MYYKVLKNEKVIDVLDHLTFLKYQPKNRIMVVCAQNEAQAIMSSDEEKIWHLKGLYRIPVDGFDTVAVEEIDEREYKMLRILDLKSPEDIIDAYTLFLVEEGLL